MLRTVQRRLGHGFLRRGFASEAVAAKLLDNAKLKPGDLVIQNGADTEAGRAVIQLAKQRGIKTLNVVPDWSGVADVVEELKVLGGDVVVTESYTNTWYIKRLMSELPKPVLAINCSDGASATSVAKLLGPGGRLVNYKVDLPSHVVYPGMERRPLKWADYLKGKNIAAVSL